MSAGLGLAVAALRTKKQYPPRRAGDEWVDVPEEEAQAGAGAPPDIRTGITMGEEIEPAEGEWADVPTDDEPRRGPLEHVSRAYGEATIGAPTLGQAVSQFAEGAPYMARHPIESAKMLGRGILESHAEAAATAKRQMARPELAHKMVGALRYGVSGIPVIGPALVHAGEQTAEREGGYWKALGTTLGAATWLATAIGGKPIVRGYEKLAARMEKAPVEISIPKPRMAKEVVTPHEAAKLTRQEVMVAAEQRGIKLTAAQATKDPLLETVEWVGGKALGGAEKLIKQTERSRAGVLEWAEDIRSKADPYRRGATEEAAGTDIRQSMQISEQVARENVRRSYDQPWMKETPVDISPVRSKFSAELSEMADQLAREPGKYGSKVSEMLTEGAELGAPATRVRVMGAEVRPSELPPRMAEQLGLAAPRQLTFAEVHQLRADFWDIGYKGRGLGIPDRTQAAARRIGHELTLEMEKSAKARGTLAEWKAADAEWQSLKLTYDDPRSTVRKILAEPDPTKAINIVFKNPTPHSLRLLAKEGYDLAAIKGEAIRRIKAKGFKLDGQGRLAGLPHEFLTELFGGEQLHKIYLMADVGRTVAPKPAGLPEKLSRYVQATSAAAIPAAVVGGGPALQMLAAGPIAAHTVAARIAASRLLKRAVTKPTEIRAGVGLAERMKAMRAHERVWPPRPKRPPEKGAIKWGQKRKGRKPVDISEIRGEDPNGFVTADGKFVLLNEPHIEALEAAITKGDKRGIYDIAKSENLMRLSEGVSEEFGPELNVEVVTKPTRSQKQTIARLIRERGYLRIIYDFGSMYPEHTAAYIGQDARTPRSGTARNAGEFMGRLEGYFGKGEEPLIQRINPREAADLGVSPKAGRPRGISRRSFVKGVGGAVVTAAAPGKLVTSLIRRPTKAAKAGERAPVPRMDREDLDPTAAEVLNVMDMGGLTVEPGGAASLVDLVREFRLDSLKSGSPAIPRAEMLEHLSYLVDEGFIKKIGKKWLTREAGSATQAAAKREPAKPSLVEKMGKRRSPISEPKWADEWLGYVNKLNDKLDKVLEGRDPNTSLPPLMAERYFNTYLRETRGLLSKASQSPNATIRKLASKGLRNLDNIEAQAKVTPESLEDLITQVDMEMSTVHQWIMIEMKEGRKRP